MAEKEKIKAIRCGWSETAQAALSISLGGEDEILKDQVLNGVAELWHFLGEGVDIWAIVRREQNELVVCCLEGIGARSVVPLIEQGARAKGCTTIRAHTLRPALARMFNGYELAEYVYRKVLN